MLSTAPRFVKAERRRIKTEPFELSHGIEQHFFSGAKPGGATSFAVPGKQAAPLLFLRVGCHVVQTPGRCDGLVIDVRPNLSARGRRFTS
jgi:hypothetical protein